MFPPWPATRVDVVAAVVVVADVVAVAVVVAAEWSARAKAREGRCDVANAVAVDAVAAAATRAGVATAGWRRVHGRWTRRLAGMEKDHGGC